MSEQEEKELKELEREAEEAAPAVAPTLVGLMKYVHFIFFGGGVVLAWLLLKILDSLWQAFPSLPYSEAVLTAVAVGIAAGITIYCWRHPVLSRLSIEIVSELSKVSWPTRKETYASTVVVIITSCIASIILGLFDFFWAWVTDFIYISG